jgi:acyl dehydratase
MPNTYDQLQVGDLFSLKRTLSPEEVGLFAQITGDDNPLHVDAEYAATTPFGKPIVHGVFLLGLVSKALGRDFPGHGSVAVSISAKFLRPVPVGEEVTIEIEVAEKLEKYQHIRMKTTGYVQIDGRKKMAFAGEAVLIPPKE